MNNYFTPITYINKVAGGQAKVYWSEADGGGSSYVPFYFLKKGIGNGDFKVAEHHSPERYFDGKLTRVTIPQYFS